VDLRAASQPPSQRRHRHRRILVQQRHERVDVVALERGSVAGQQILLRAVHRPRPRR
jgi:hypothetical protein